MTGNNPSPLVGENEDEGRWITDPHDPEYEIWESEKVPSEDVGDVRLATRGFDANRKPKEVVWGDGRKPNANRVCTARRTNGEPCTRIAIAGGNVCPAHGGKSPIVRAKAKARLEGAADRMARELLGMATDPDLPPNVKLAAVKDALDRANVSGKSEVEVSVTTPLFEQILGGLRSESRSARGEVDDVDPALSWVQEELTAQVVDDADEYEHTSPQPDAEGLEIIDAEIVTPQANTGGLQSLEDALAILHEAQPPTAPPAPGRSNPH